tara:strand:+ start:13362 stop:15776 length:2415 start_codon:yes stop_codon:yes gene_type:complete
MAEMFQLGRSSNNDMVLNNAYVSSTHARMRRRDGMVYLEDAGSSNGTFLNSLNSEVRDGLVEVRPDDIFYFSENYRLPGNLLLKRFEEWEHSGGQALTSGAGGSVQKFNAAKIRFGSGRNNEVILPYLSVHPNHAELNITRGGVRYIRPKGAPVYINGVAYADGKIQINPSDLLELGGVSISLNFDPANPENIVVGTEREGIYVQVDQLTFEVTDRRTGQPKKILQGIDLCVFPGEFVGLLGPSGCGKTTLLNALSGSVPGFTGDVLYNGIDMLSNRRRFESQIGYVPQDDIMHAELTVREVLFYNAKLRLPASTSSEAIHEKIDQLCEDLGLWDPNGKLDLRDELVGSPEKKTLSGGQKKRVNLAIELLTDPRVLFLDEPTSGLSSKDTRVVMEILRKLADSKGIAIIITIHQPSTRVYKLLDKTIYLKAGHLCYFGTAYPDSIQYFVPNQHHDAAGPDGIMENIDDLPEEDMAHRYRGSSHYEKNVGQRFALLSRTPQDKPKNRAPSERASAVTQYFQLTKRYVQCKLRDRSSLLILLIQAPLVAIFLALAFRDKAVNPPLFLLTFVAIWFGTNNSARELVGEVNIFNREARFGQSPLAYLMSKISVLGVIGLVQCAILVFLTVHFLDLTINPVAGLAVCWLASMIGVGLGLLVSAWSKTEVTAIVLIPIILIPFIFFGGLLAQYDRAGVMTKSIMEVMPSRWAFEAISHLEALNYEGYIGPPTSRDPDAKAPLGNFSEEKIDDVDGSVDNYRKSRIALSLFLFFPYFGGALFATYFRLRKMKLTELGFLRNGIRIPNLRPS